MTDAPIFKEGDTFVADSGNEWTVERSLAYRGKKGCTNPSCTMHGNILDSCYGWHCSQCDAPCSMMGHECRE